MRLENIVWDSRDPQRLGAFWSAALGAEVMTDEPDIYEARRSLGDEAFVDLCFQRVDDPFTSSARLHLDLAGGARQQAVVDRLLTLGAEYADIGQEDVAWVVLADPEGNAFCVMDHRDAYQNTGSIAALPLDSSDPERDARFWAQLTGWVPVDGLAPATLRHPSGTGPLLELCSEPGPKDGKNRLHFDVRPDAADGDLVGRAIECGARWVDTADGLPWVVLADPSGNELCVLEPRSA